MTSQPSRLGGAVTDQIACFCLALLQEQVALITPSFALSAPNLFQLNLLVQVQCIEDQYRLYFYH